MPGPGAGLAEEGVVYVPKACEEQKGCRVHVALHGCEQSREKVGDTFVKESGFAAVADANRLIVLFPQVSASTVNPQGCWDWWGYTGLDFLGKDAPQIAAIWAMVERLASTHERQGSRTMRYTGLLPVACLPLLCGAAPARPERSRSISRLSRVVDLTHAFDKDTIYWPTSPSGFELKPLHQGLTGSRLLLLGLRLLRA